MLQRSRSLAIGKWLGKFTGKPEPELLVTLLTLNYFTFQGSNHEALNHTLIFLT